MLPLDYKLGARFLYAEPGGQVLFTNNETHSERVFGPGAKSRSPFVKDAFHRFIIQGERCVNPGGEGTKAGVHYANCSVPPGGSIVLRFRFTNEPLAEPLKDVDQIISQRQSEADEPFVVLPSYTPWPERAFLWIGLEQRSLVVALAVKFEDPAAGPNAESPVNCPR